MVRLEGGSRWVGLGLLHWLHKFKAGQSSSQSVTVPYSTDGQGFLRGESNFVWVFVR